MGNVASKKLPIVEGLLSLSDSGPHLIGSKCPSCGAYFFPKGSYCPDLKCKRTALEEVALSTRGKLYTYTVQYYLPPPPYKFDGDFSPYAIGLIELPEGIRVLGQLAGCDPKEIQIGMEVELIAEKQFTDDQGNEYMMWKFRRA